jgi:hypothetical protein
VFAVACLWLFPLLLGEQFSDVPVQLPLYGVLAAFAGIGFARVHHALRLREWATPIAAAVLAATVAVAGVCTYAPTFRKRDVINAYRDSIEAIAGRGR